VGHWRRAAWVLPAIAFLAVLGVAAGDFLSLAEARGRGARGGAHGGYGGYGGSDGLMLLGIAIGALAVCGFLRSLAQPPW
jgi:hypothetical protein